MTEPTLCAICHQPAHRYGIPDPEHEYDAMGCVNMLLPALDLERNRADEAVRAMEANIVTLEQCGEELNAAEAECERLRAINRELVCSHNDLLLVIVRQDEAARERLAALADPPDPKEPSE